MVWVLQYFLCVYNYVASDSPPPVSSAFGFDIGSGQRRFFEKEDSDASSEEESEEEQEEEWVDVSVYCSEWSLLSEVSCIVVSFLPAVPNIILKQYWDFSKN